MTVDPTSEIIDINEQAAIRLAFAHLAGCCQHGKIVAYDHIAQEFSILTYEDKAFSNLVHKYLSQKLDPDGKTVMDSLIYDMRYGAFGPHHFIHIFDQFVFSLDLKKLMN